MYKNKISKCLNFIANTIEIIVLFFIGLIVFSAISGILCVFFHLNWGWCIFFVNLLGACIIAKYLKDNEFLGIDYSIRGSIYLIFLTIFMIAIYIEYSPYICVEQDPSIYIFKALNLVNYGTFSRSASKYYELIESGVISSVFDKVGTSMIYDGAGNLQMDFYPGESFFLAMIGKVYKPFIFYGQTVIATITGVLFYSYLRGICAGNDEGSILAVLSFFIAPVTVFFFRGSYTDSFALLMVLLCIQAVKKQCSIKLLMLFFLASYSARIEFFLLMLIGIVIISYQSHNMGIVFTICCCIQNYIYKRTCPIYYKRITAVDMPIIKYQIVFYVIVLAMTLLVKKLKEDLPQLVLEHKATKVFIIVIGVLATILIFRDNITSTYEMKIIHEHYIRTYSESVLDLIALSYPMIVILIGFLCVYRFLDLNLGTWTSFILLAYFILYMMALLDMSNSPQLYWALRRYIYNVIPLAYISCAYTVQSSGKRLNVIFWIVCLILSINAYFNSEQTVNYSNLDKSVIDADNWLHEHNIDTIYFNNIDAKELTPLIMYGAYQFVPLDVESLDELQKHNEVLENSIIISTIDIGTSIDCLSLKYSRMGETMGALPTETYETEINYYVYSAQTLEENKMLFYNKRDEFTFDNIDIQMYNGSLEVNDSDICLSVMYKCREDVVYERKGLYNLSYHIYDANGNTVVGEGDRTEIEKYVTKGQMQNLTINIDDLPKGNYTLEIDVVNEGTAWGKTMGEKTIDIPFEK